jgi:hypothetical protein
MREYIGHLRWLWRIAAIVGALLLIARIDSPAWTSGDRPMTQTLAALVTCVLPAVADDVPAESASVSPSPVPDCESSTTDSLHGSDSLRGPWMTRC